MADCREKYKFLKRKLKILVYEHESLTQELEKSQRKLLKVTRDNSFLLDRLLQYEKVISNSPHDSDATLSSDSDIEPPQKKKNVGSTTSSANRVPLLKEEFVDKNEPAVTAEKVIEEVDNGGQSKPKSPLIKSENEDAEIDMQMPSDEPPS